MKLRKIFAGMAASAIALSTMAVVASADQAGIAFQTDNYTARNEYGKEGWGPADGREAAFPNTIVGVQGGGYGYQDDVAFTDATINGDGTYKISMPCSGVINVDIPVNDDGTKNEGDLLNWNLHCNYGKDDDGNTIETNPTKGFNFIFITTDFDYDYDDDNEVALVNGNEVHCKNVKITYGGKTYELAEAPVNAELDYLGFQVFNVYNKEWTDQPALEAPPADGTLDIEFTLEGLSGGSGSGDNNSSTANSSGSGNDSSSTSSTGSTTSTTGTTKTGTNNAGGTQAAAGGSDATDTQAATGATAGLVFAGIALAGAAVVITRRK